jgi:hypothetical protein
VRWPGRPRSWVVLAAMLGMASAQQSAPDWPEWSAEDRQALLGGAALTGAGLFDPRREDGGPADAPRGLERIETLRVDEPRRGPAAIGEEFLGAYFDRRPESFLVDPQMLLARQERDDQLGFLDYHAGESAIDLYFYLFDRDQELPGEVRAEELAERLFGGGRPAAIVYYHLGAPERAKVLLTSQVAERISAPEQRQALRTCIEAALDKANPVDQLAGFAAQMSIRLYWMEKALQPVAGGGQAVAVPMEARAPNMPAGESRTAVVMRQVAPWAWQAGAASVALVAMWLLRWWRARRRTYLLPEFDQPTRLGGAHAAGIGAVISFPSGGGPPTLQRDQLPDYLRRV